MTDSRTSSETGRFTLRRLRSAFFLWRTSIRGVDIAIACVLAALSLALGGYLFLRARAAAPLAFAQRAQRLQAEIRNRLAVPIENLDTLSLFIQASGRLTRRQFQVLTQPRFVGRKYLYALEWLPFVPASERPAYEAEARAFGFPEYGFWDQGPGGKPRRSPERPFYVPIHFMEPPSALALGFDIAASPFRWSTAERALDSGEIVASPPFGLVEDAHRQGAPPAVAVYRAVYRDGDPGAVEARRASLMGFLIAIIQVEPLVNDAALQVVDASGLGYALRDLDAGAAPHLADRPPDAASVPRRPGFALEAPFPVDFAGRRWGLDVFALPGSFLPSTRSALEVATIGTLASIFGFVLVTALRTITRLRRQAEKVGPYRLTARLGRGAMGVVWEARHALLRRPTAVKLLAPGTEGERAIARFEREVQLTAGLTHPSTIAIYDYGRTADGTFYYAMELLRGINLMQLVRFDGPLPAGRVVHLLTQACGALSEAHAAGLIHRDIKPANLMICVYGGIPDFLKVLDFGLVKDVGAVDPVPGEAAAAPPDAALSQDGSLLGTPLYMAPEGMSDPAGVDPRADLFAVGAVGYYLLTGHSPFPGQTALEVFAKERQGPPPDLAREAPNPVPASLERILRRCLAFRREDRPVSAEELEAMLRACDGVTPWTLEDARRWWGEKGPGALAIARAEREERGHFLTLSSGFRDRT